MAKKIGFCPGGFQRGDPSLLKGLVGTLQFLGGAYQFGVLDLQLFAFSGVLPAERGEGIVQLEPGEFRGIGRTSRGHADDHKLSGGEHPKAAVEGGWRKAGRDKVQQEWLGSQLGLLDALVEPALHPTR